MSGYVPSNTVEQILKKAKAKQKTSSSGGDSFGIAGLTSQAGTLSEAIEKQAAAQKQVAAAKSPTSSVDPLKALQQQLFAALNGVNSSITGTPLDQLQKIANQQAGAQYDPLIQALTGQMSATNNRANRNSAETSAMYNALSKDTLAELPGLTQQFAAEDKATNSRYDDAQNVLNQQYGTQAKQQNDVLQNLGIQAASQGSSQQAQDDQKYFQSQLELDQQNALSALNEEQNSASVYQRNSADNAKMAGANGVQDIKTQLEDYMTQAQGQLGGLQSQKQSAISSLLAQMQQQDSDRVEKQRQAETDNLMAAYRFQLDATNSQFDHDYKLGKVGGASNSAFKGTSGLAGASSYLASQYPNQPIMASNLLENINSVLSNKDVVNGKFVLDPGNASLGKGPTYSDVGQEYMIDLLRKQFENQGSRYGAGDVNTTINALLAYMGKLK